MINLLKITTFQPILAFNLSNFPPNFVKEKIREKIRLSQFSPQRLKIPKLSCHHTSYLLLQVRVHHTFEIKLEA